MGVETADAFAEQFGGQRRAALRLNIAEPVAAQRRLPVQARGFPDRDLARRSVTDD
jgi:hypothetical protein